MYDGYMSLSQQPLTALDFVHNRDTPEEPETPATRRAAQRFRAVLTRILTDEARGVGAGDDDLAALDRVLARAGAARGLVPTVRGYGWGWTRDPGAIVRRLFPAAWSTVQLLTGEARHRLKCCDGCGRLFLDRSRNRSRRWCEMEACGNRAKVRRHRIKLSP
jgi:predicted RNA-binding Zn ribbon-like protein